MWAAYCRWTYCMPRASLEKLFDTLVRKETAIIEDYLYTQDWKIPMGKREAWADERMEKEMDTVYGLFKKHPSEMTDSELMEAARKCHGELYKRMASKTAEIRKLENRSGPSKEEVKKRIQETLDYLNRL